MCVHVAYADCSAPSQLLFKTPLMNKDDVWDSIKATDSNQNVDVFLRQLPSYNNDARYGCNTLVIRAQMISLSGGGFERQWAGINIGRSPSKEAAAEALRETLLGHVYWRVDPVKLGQRDDAPTYKYRFGQTYKQTGRYSSDVKKDRAFSLITWPFKPDRPFFIRLILHPWGMLSYVDGKFFSYTPYPGFQAPKEGETLYLQIPVAGDAGEKPTWKILSAHWGSCRIDVDGERSMVEYMNSDVGRAALSSAQVESEDEIYLTGVPQAASEAVIVEAFKQWGAITAHRDPGKPGAATVKLALGSFSSLRDVVAQIHAKVQILGVAINTRINLTAVKLYRAPPSAPAAAGAGAGAGSSMSVGFAPFASSAQLHAGPTPAFSPSGGGSASTGSGGAGNSGFTPASAAGGSDTGGAGSGSSPAYNPTSPAYGGSTSPAGNPAST